MAPEDAHISQKCFGLLNRRQRWGLSLNGWLLLAFFTSAVLFGLLLTIYPFLSVTGRLDTRVLIVEGWIPESAIKRAANEISTHNYDVVLTTGGPVAGTGPYSNEYNTSASVGYTRLISAGVPKEMVRKVPSKVRDRDRTYSSAVALRKWLSNSELHPRSLNVITESVHARRSRLLFQKALGHEIRVGIISIPPNDYPASRWWRYSAGVKEVISEGAAYLYVRLFFWPPEPRP